MYKILGTVKTKTDLQTFKNTDFTKIDLTIVDNNGTPYKMEFHKEKTDLLKEISVDKEVVVYFTIRGSFYDAKDENGKLTGEKLASNSLVAYNIKTLD